MGSKEWLPIISGISEFAICVIMKIFLKCRKVVKYIQKTFITTLSNQKFTCIILAWITDDILLVWLTPIIRTGAGHRGLRLAGNDKTRIGAGRMGLRMADIDKISH